MNPQINSIIEHIRKLENELEQEFAKQRDKLRYTLVHGKIQFEEEILRRHKELRTGLASYIFRANPLVILTAPVIYSVVFPLILLDIFVTTYQLLCFPIYRISKVKRADHLIFDRHRLAYLNGIQKLNCAYCSYANGLISYAREIAARTEQYWCPIKHSRRVAAAHGNYPEFADFGDADDFEKRLQKLREKLNRAE